MQRSIHHCIYSISIVCFVLVLPQCTDGDDGNNSLKPVPFDEMMNIGGSIMMNYECGDGYCQPSESATSCEIDCAYCGDHLCNLMESEQSCPIDCLGHGIEAELDMSMSVEDSSLSHCGDSICESQEDAQSCPQDCETIEDMMIHEGPVPDPNQQVIGYVDSLEIRDGQWTISGWACHIGWSPSIDIEIYAGGDNQTGTLIKRERAEEDQESAVGDACGVAEGNHRFNIPFTQEELTEYAGEVIHVHAISPVNAEDHALTNSGRYFLPGQGTGDNGGGMLPVDLNQITWLHTDVSGWPVTSNLSVSFRGGEICLDYDKSNVWPSVSIPHSSGNGTVDVVANPWVILNYNGQWYAGTWEWLAVGRICRNKNSVAGDHIKRFAQIPMDWRPTPGQTLYFMVSSLARTSTVANVQERTNIVEVVWQ